MNPFKEMNSEIEIRDELLARLAHLCWRCYQMGAGQAHNDPTFDNIESQKNGWKFFHKNPGATSEDNHKNWMDHKLALGWKYALVKSIEKKEHPDLVPYAELPEVERAKDDMDNLSRKELWSLITEAVGQIRKIDRVQGLQ
jgi:hypothetical protein